MNICIVEVRQNSDGDGAVHYLDWDKMTDVHKKALENEKGFSTTMNCCLCKGDLSFDEVTINDITLVGKTVHIVKMFYFDKTK